MNCSSNYGCSLTAGPGQKTTAVCWPVLAMLGLCDQPHIGCCAAGTAVVGDTGRCGGGPHGWTCKMEGSPSEVVVVGLSDWHCQLVPIVLAGFPYWAAAVEGCPPHCIHCHCWVLPSACRCGCIPAMLVFPNWVHCPCSPPVSGCCCVLSGGSRHNFFGATSSVSFFAVAPRPLAEMPQSIAPNCVLILDGSKIRFPIRWLVRWSLNCIVNVCPIRVSPHFRMVRFCICNTILPCSGRCR